jgi:beta-galactosidase
VRADGIDLAFVTVRVVDERGRTVPRAQHAIRFRIEGPGQIVATDNGDPTDFTAFPSPERRAFHGLCLVIVRGVAGAAGTIALRAEASPLQGSSVTLRSAAPPL